MSPSTAAANRSLALVSAGGSGAAGSYTDFDAVSQDGSTVIFSTTKRLLPQDTDHSVDVYMQRGDVTTLVSTAPTGGGGEFPASFAGTPTDGSEIFFETEERLTSDDTDNSLDVYMWSGGVTTLVSKGPAGGNGAYDAYFVGSSQDAGKVFFQTSEQLVNSDTDSAQDVYQWSAGTTTLLSSGPSGGNGNYPAAYAGSSADGSHVFLETNERLTSDDTDSSQDVYDRSGGTTTLLSTGPAAGNGAFKATFEGASADGSKVFFTTRERLTSGDTDAQADIYQSSGGTTTLLSTGSSGGNGNAAVTFVGSSVDGSHVFFETQERLVPEDVDGFIDVYDHTSAGTALISPGRNDNQGAANAYYLASSEDGSTAFFRTDESLTADDTDGYQDIYQHTGSTTTLVSTGTTGGNAALNVKFGGVSADGSDVFFETYESLDTSDTDTNVDIYERSNGTTTPVTRGASGGNGPFDATFAGMAPNGSRAFFETDETLLGADSDNSTDLYSADLPAKVVIVKQAQPQSAQDFTFTAGGGLNLGPTAPPGQNTFLLSDGDPNVPNTRTFDDVQPGAGYSVTEAVPNGWDLASATCENGSSPSNISVAPGETVTCTFTNVERGKIVILKEARPQDPHDFSFTAGGGLSPSNFLLDDDNDPTLSNTRVFDNVTPGSGYSVSEAPAAAWLQVSATCDNGSPVSNIDVGAGETVTCTFLNEKGYPRPKGATPMRVALVEAYRSCASPNRAHGTPLNVPSCAPPTQSSNYLTVGTLDANGQQANSVGSLRLDVVVGNPSTPANEADVRLRFSLTDVRKLSDLSDYTGELSAAFNLRITDKQNGPAVNEPGTTTDFPFSMPVACAATSSDTIGASCNVSTTANALIPGAVVEVKRTIWQMGDVQVFDGGADGVASTQDNTLFGHQGVFVP